LSLLQTEGAQEFVYRHHVLCSCGSLHTFSRGEQ